MAKKKKWIQAASASIKKRGTEGVCTGPKFGGPTCPPGSKRYNLAKVFKGMAKKKKKAATGAMIHAKDSKYIKKDKKKWTREEKIKIMTGPIPREFLHTPKRFLKSDPRMLRQGGMLKAKTSAFAANPDAWKKARGASTTGMKVAGAGTAGVGWTTKINKSLNKLKNMMKLGRTTAMGAGLSKYTSKIPKASQLKTLAKTGGRRSLALAGGPIGLGMYAGTMGAKHLVTKAFDPYRDKATGKISKKGHETLAAAARTREALMAKRNKARNAKTGTMVKANVGTEVLGKQSVPFESAGATANLANERQGRKGAAVRGFNFKGVF